ncbi:LysR substrate-binding domain-containing protein [Primorskyibacter flagellatus]|uniref:LysR substrate-binding domain-containing protein n=1 Tax=Primorskyibacter flagellatus TaxID=1387277 RepID=UPI003A9459BC
MLIDVTYIPHLNGLRTFSVAARHLNFTTAAAELNVSPSAVSHQIRQLEEYLATRLFDRTARQLSLTAEGDFLYRRLDDPFQKIGLAIEQMRTPLSTKSVSLLCRPFFSSLWLAPRLRSLWTTLPGIDLNLIHKTTFTLADAETVDLAILWGQGGWPDMKCERLVKGTLTPIMGRRLARAAGIPETPNDLSRYTLLHEENRTHWSTWLEKAGVPNLKTTGSVLVDDTNVRLQQVLNGQGIMLSDPALLSELVGCGELIRPFDLTLGEYSYYLAWPSRRPPEARVHRVIDWLLTESQTNASN